ncbi:hypothetical protein pb186bvf_005143 [Paramecium bursaria]
MLNFLFKISFIIQICKYNPFNLYKFINYMKFLLLIVVSYSQQIFTTTNTCSNEKTIFKLDIRDRVEQLGPGYSIEDLDTYSLCQEAYNYDFIWLQQLWIPSQYNFKDVGGIPQVTNDYREFQNIKEYLFDPSLGTLTNLYQFQKKVKKYCPHIQFLGEFSFYMGQDSYLMQNQSRFLKRPLYDNPNIQNRRYDDNNYVWAFNDQYKTVPYSAVWNYFNQNTINDLQDLIFRLIIQQHKLDGIVFLQPAFGLYSVAKQFYGPEIADQGASTMLQDFYYNMGLHLQNQSFFFMGGDDAFNLKSQLLNGLQQVYGQPTNNDWANINFTWSQTDRSGYTLYLNPKLIQGNLNNFFYANVIQGVSATQNTCIRYNWTSYLPSWGGASIGINCYGIANYLLSYQYVQHPDSLLYGYPSFYYQSFDQVEIQFEPLNKQLRFKKYLNTQQTSFLASQTTYNLVKFTVMLNHISTQLQIGFPFQYSQIFKSQYQSLQGQRHILQTQTTQLYQFTQIIDSINQIESYYQLNFLILSNLSNSNLGVGVCNKDLMNLNLHQQLSAGLGSGAYILYNNGMQMHNISTLYNNQIIPQTYAQGDLVTVKYTSSNNSIQFYKNAIYMTQMILIDRVKNLNFCVSMNQQGSCISLEY